MVTNTVARVKNSVSTTVTITERKSLAEWLRVFFDTYDGQLFSPEAVEGYRVALEPLSADERDVAFPEAIRRAGKYAPRPGEILSALAAVKEQQPRRAATARRDCRDCDGTGYKVIPHPTAGDGYFVATPCVCRK